MERYSAPFIQSVACSSFPKIAPRCPSCTVPVAEEARGRDGSSAGSTCDAVPWSDASGRKSAGENFIADNDYVPQTARQTWAGRPRSTSNADACLIFSRNGLHDILVLRYLLTNHDKQRESVHSDDARPATCRAIRATQRYRCTTPLRRGCDDDATSLMTADGSNPALWARHFAPFQHGCRTS